MARSFGERLKAAREAAGLTVRDVSRAADLTTQHVYGLEADKSSPTLATLRRLADAIGVEPGELV